ncbi:hypothetical protein Tco_0636783 [Tanacetum coccineum]
MMVPWTWLYGRPMKGNAIITQPIEHGRNGGIRTVKLIGVILFDFLINKSNKGRLQDMESGLECEISCIMNLVGLALGGILTCYRYTAYVFVYIHKEGFLVVKGRMNLLMMPCPLCLAPTYSEDEAAMFRGKTNDREMLLWVMDGSLLSKKCSHGAKVMNKVRFSPPLVFAFIFEMVGSLIYTVTSMLTQRELDHHCSVFNILVELGPELPNRNGIIKDCLEGNIRMYTRFIEFANYRVPLSKFLLCVIEYYQIILSRLSVIGMAKVSHFEIMCCAFGRIPTIELEQPFLWIDASVCPLSTSWFSGTSIVKDLLPVDEAVDLPCMELLNENRTLIRKYPETFLCFMGLCRSFTKTDVHPTLLHDNDEEMGLLDFVKSDDPFKVKVGERTLAENEVPLITETEDRVISPSLQTISLIDHTIQDELNVNSSKRRKRVAFVSGSPPTKKARTKGIGEQAVIGSGSAAAVIEDVTSSFVTLTLECAFEDAPRDNVGTSVHMAESVGDGHPLSAPELETGTLSATPSQGFSVDDFYKSQTIDSATALNVYVPNWSVTNNAHLDNLVTCRNLLDHVTPPDYWVMLRNQHDVGFLDSFNINSAQHICMVSELCLRYKHEIMMREKYENRFTDSAAMVQHRDEEVTELKAKLEKSESEVTEVEELRKHISDLEATIAVKVGEAASLTAQNAGLLEKVSALELERDGLKGQVVGESKMQKEFVSYQDAAEWCFVKCATELDASIVDVRRDMDNELYPHMLTAIASGVGLLGTVSVWLFISVHAPMNVVLPWLRLFRWPLIKITILKTNTLYPSRKMRRICACTHQRPRGIKLNTPYPEDQYAVLELWNQYNILEDIKRGPYSKKSPIRRIQYLDMPYQTNFHTL